MDTLRLLNITSVISLIIITVSFILLFSFLYKGYKVGKKIKENTYELSKNASVENVLKYINFVDSIEVPDRKIYWNTLKAAYRIVEIGEGIDDDLKVQLRKGLLGKGVLV